MSPTRMYRYVGPAGLCDVQSGAGAIAVTTSVLLADRLSRREVEERAEPFTFVVMLDGSLRLAPCRSEHVGLAGRGVILAAGEMMFARVGADWIAVEVTNQSAGCCSDPDSWPGVAPALDSTGVAHPGDFTDKVTLPLCPNC